MAAHYKKKDYKVGPQGGASEDQRRQRTEDRGSEGRSVRTEDHGWRAGEGKRVGRGQGRTEDGWEEGRESEEARDGGRTGGG